MRGLGGHAMRTWTHTATEKLWLRGVLLLTIPNARIMHGSRAVDSRNILRIIEIANSLLTRLGNYRNSLDLKVCDSVHLPRLSILEG